MHKKIRMDSLPIEQKMQKNAEKRSDTEFDKKETMCYKYVNAVNRYTAGGNNKTTTSPNIEGSESIVYKRNSFVSGNSPGLCIRGKQV